MTKQPISLTPEEVRVLARCSLHYHFMQQGTDQPKSLEATLEMLVRDAIQQLHAAGGPARLSRRECLAQVAAHPMARQMVAHYYDRLKQDWSQMMAGNETLTLKISIGGIPVQLSGTLDRLDKTSDGGILAILFRTETGPLPTAAELRRDHAMTIYHALVAANYPHKRPVRLQELWLSTDQSVTIELSEEEYRQNLGHLREPVRALARGEVMARPGLHCDICPFKHRGCPVYTHETHGAGTQNEADDLDSSSQPGKIPPRKWVFKI